MSCRLAAKNCTARMHAFSKELYDSMGVRVFIFGCYAKPNGTLYVSTYNVNWELGNGTDYIDVQGQRFQEDGIMVSSWRAQDLTLANGGHQRGQAAMSLEKNSYGEPILLDTLKPPMKSSTDVRKWRLNVLCGFVNQHYSEPSSTDLSLLILKLHIYLDLASGQQKGSAPWMAIGAKLLNYVDEEYIPEAWRAVTLEGDNVYKFLNPNFQWRWSLRDYSFGIKGKKEARWPSDSNLFRREKGFKKHLPDKTERLHCWEGNEVWQKKQGTKRLSSNRVTIWWGSYDWEGKEAKQKQGTPERPGQYRIQIRWGSSAETKRSGNPKFTASWVDSDVGTESGSDEEAWPRMKKSKSKDRRESTEFESDDEAWPQWKKAVEDQKTKDGWEGDDQPNVPSSGGNVKQMAKAELQVRDAQWDSDNLSAGNGSYWEADLGDQSGGGKKRK